MKTLEELCHQLIKLGSCDKLPKKKYYDTCDNCPGGGNGSTCNIRVIGAKLEGKTKSETPLELIWAKEYSEQLKKLKFLEGLSDEKTEDQ